MRTRILLALAFQLWALTAWAAPGCSPERPWRCTDPPLRLGGWVRLACFGSRVDVLVRAGGRGSFNMPLPLSSCSGSAGVCTFDLSALCATRLGPCDATRLTVATGQIGRIRHRGGAFLLRCTSGGLDPFVYPGFCRKKCRRLFRLHEPAS